MESDTLPSSHSHSLQDAASLSSRSDQDGVAPLTRGVVTLAVGDGLGIDLGCVSITLLQFASQFVQAEADTTLKQQTSIS
jgi:hypothetical protein